MCSLPYIVVDASQLPSEASDEFFHEQLYVNGSFSIENLVVDSSWNERLMPNFLIRKKRINRINQLIDNELNEVDPDMISVIRLNREKELLSDAKWLSKTLTPQQVAANDLQMAQLALSELDARVASGESDKPVIRQKLQDKISLLQE